MLVRRVILALLLLGLVIIQVAIPSTASSVGTEIPEVAYLVAPYSLAAIVFIGCVQIALVATWRLLSMADVRGEFDRRAILWLDLIAVCGLVAASLAAIVAIHVARFVPGRGGPTNLYVAMAFVCAVQVIFLALRMRRRIARAVDRRAEDR